MVLALASAVMADNAAASAGSVDFSIGGVVATRPDGQQRPLTKGAELENGDAIHTNSGRAQLRFPDGAYVSLQPNTVLVIREYNFDGKTDGSERGFFSLLRGAMRAVTGLIGRVHHSAYQIVTPTATVGIRGTGGLIVILPDGSTLIRGSSGIWSLSNASGSIDVPAGTSGLASTDSSTPPQETSGVPSVPPAPPRTAGSGFVAGDERNSAGNPVALRVVPLQSGGGYSANIAYGVTLAGTVGVLNSAGSATGSFDTSGRLTGVSSGSNTYQLISGAQTEFGTDGILAWGRWIGSAAVPGARPGIESYNADQGLHYVIGMPTPTLPASGTATYALLGATSPTYVDGHTAPGVFSGSINVTFGARPVAAMDFNIAMPDQTFALKATATSLSGSTFAVSAAATNSSVCSVACPANINGFFAGANAERIGLGYIINPGFTASQAYSVLGAAAFEK